jgi:hypothetical protein
VTGDNRIDLALVNGGGASALDYVATLTYQATTAPTSLALLAPVSVLPGLSLGQVSATLTRSDTGAPLAGRTVTFSDIAGTLCSSVTDSNGLASCDFSLANAITTIVSLGYQATFAGDGDYAGVTATSPLIQIGPIPLL